MASATHSRAVAPTTNNTHHNEVNTIRARTHITDNPHPHRGHGRPSGREPVATGKGNDLSRSG